MGLFDKIKDALDGIDEKAKEVPTTPEGQDPTFEAPVEAPVENAPATDEPAEDLPMEDINGSHGSIFDNMREAIDKAGQAVDQAAQSGTEAITGEGAPQVQYDQTASEAPAVTPEAPAPAPEAPAPEAPAPAPEAPAPAPEAPAPAPEAAPAPETYTVVEGDNLSVIGESYGVSVDALVEANGIENPDLIFPGQVLTIPR